MEIAQLSTNRRTDKQTEIHSYNGVLLSNKRNEPLNPTTWLNLKKQMGPRDRHQKQVRCINSVVRIRFKENSSILIEKRIAGASEGGAGQNFLR